MYQFTEQGYRWRDKVRGSIQPGGGGIKAAFDRRDSRFQGYRASRKWGAPHEPVIVTSARSSRVSATAAGSTSM